MKPSLGSGLVSHLGRLNIVLILAVTVYAVVRAIAEDGLGIPQDMPADKPSRQVGDLLSFALISGLAAFATIEVVKRLFALRGWFQLERTRAWFYASGQEGHAAFKQLIAALGTHWSKRDLRQLFNLPTEQLAAQIGVAVEVALTSRGERYLPLISALAGKEALDEFMEMASDPMRTMPDDDLGLLPLSQRVRAGVDRLQISLGEEWRRFIQGTALWLAGMFGIAFAYLGGIGEDAHARSVLVALVLGGVFAWTARDLTRVVERARR